MLIHIFSNDTCSHSLQAMVVRHAVCQTELGFAGYVEVRTPDGTEIRIAGRYDDAFSQEEDKPAHVAEHIWVNGEYYKQEDGENSTRLQTPSGEYKAEYIMMAMCKALGMKGPGVV